MPENHEGLRRPVSVLVVALDPDHRTLLLKRKDLPDFWQSVTGSLDPSETALDAAVRELREETGIAGAPLEFTGMVRRFEILPAHRHRYPPGNRHNLEYEFVCKLDHRAPVRINPAEHSEYTWMPVREAAARVWSWTNREALERLMKHG